jgi:hypothetical protein
MPQEPAKPDGWEKLRREGDPDGYPEVGHDKKRHQNFTVRRDGSICWHESPPASASATASSRRRTTRGPRR